MADRINRNIDWITDDYGQLVGYQIDKNQRVPFGPDALAALGARVDGLGSYGANLISTWAEKPDASSYPIGTKIFITDIPSGGSGTIFVSSGIRWTRAEWTRIAGSAAAASAFTGSTIETTQASFVIPGGLLGPNGRLRATAKVTCNNSANPHYLRMYLGAGKVLDYPPANVTYIGAEADIANRNTQAAQVSTPQNLATSNGSGVNTLLTSAVDTSVDQTFSIAFWLGSGADSMQLQDWNVDFIAP